MGVLTVLAFCGVVLISTRDVITHTSSNIYDRKCETDKRLHHMLCDYWMVEPCGISLNVSGSSLPPDITQTIKTTSNLPHMDYLLYFDIGNSGFVKFPVQYVQMFLQTEQKLCIVVHPVCMSTSAVFLYKKFCIQYGSDKPDMNRTAELTNWLFSGEIVASFRNGTELSIKNETCSKGEMSIMLPPGTEIINIVDTNCAIDLLANYDWESYTLYSIRLSYISAMNFTGSEKTVSKLINQTNYLMGGLPYPLDNLVSLDISQSYQYQDLKKQISMGLDLHVLKNFYARNYVPFPCSFHTKLRKYIPCIEAWYSNENFLTTIICIRQETLESLELLDISQNKIEYIDTSLTDVLIGLKVLDVSGNLLHTGSRYGDTDINIGRMSGLTELYCSNNELNKLSADIFDALPNLTAIDLSFNKLTSLTFRIQHLYQLQLLNLYKNEIKLLDSLFMAEQFTNLVRYQRTYFDTSINLNLVENPLICSIECKNKAAVAWILKHENEIRVWPMSCELKHTSKNINTFTLDAIRESCKEPLYIGIACLLSAITAAVIIITFVVVCRHRLRHVRERRLQNQMRSFKEDTCRDRFPVFLSFCSSNADFVMENVFEELNHRIQELIGTTRRCVAFGDADFRPGAVVIDEMIRCIFRCDVVIFCVSNDFLRSPWCTDEVRITHFQRKPVNLMFLEEVDMKLLAKSVLFCYYMKSYRAKWTNVNGMFNLQPDWHVLCRRAVSHMPEHAADLDEDETKV